MVDKPDHEAPNRLPKKWVKKEGANEWHLQEEEEKEVDDKNKVQPLPLEHLPS